MQEIEARITPYIQLRYLRSPCSRAIGVQCLEADLNISGFEETLE